MPAIFALETPLSYFLDSFRRGILRSWTSALRSSKKFVLGSGVVLAGRRIESACSFFLGGCNMNYVIWWNWMNEFQSSVTTISDCNTINSVNLAETNQIAVQ